MKKRYSEEQIIGPRKTEFGKRLSNQGSRRRTLS